MPLITNPKVKSLLAKHRSKTTFSASDFWIMLVIAVFISLVGFVAMLGAIYPDLSGVVAAPFVCDGTLERESARFAYDAPGQTTITHHYECVDEAGVATDYLGEVLGACMLFWTLVVFVLLMLKRLVTIGLNRLIIRGKEQQADTVLAVLLACMGLGTTAVAVMRLKPGLAAEPVILPTILAGLVCAWVSLLFWRMLIRRTLFRKPATDEMLRLRALFNVPFGIAAAQGLSAATIWYGLVSDDLTAVGSVILGGIAGLAGLYFMIRTLRFVVRPDLYRGWLEKAAQGRALARQQLTDPAPSPKESPQQRLKWLPPTAPSDVFSTPSVHEAGDDLSQGLANIERAAALHARGLLTDDEFKRVKAEALDLNKD
jgi:hypothetical protein